MKVLDGQSTVSPADPGELEGGQRGACPTRDAHARQAVPRRPLPLEAASIWPSVHRWESITSAQSSSSLVPIT